MNFTDAISALFRRTFDFKGRSRRSEYWFAYLFLIIIRIISEAIDMAGSFYFQLDEIKIGIVYSLVSLITFIPFLSMGFRRLHDTNRSFSLFVLLPTAILIGLLQASVVIPFLSILAMGYFGWLIFILVLLCLPGTIGVNKYGPNPKEQSEYIKKG